MSRRSRINIFVLGAATQEENHVTR